MVNKVLKNKAVRMVASLAAIGIISGISLVYVYKYASPKIEMNVAGEKLAAISKIFPEMEKTEGSLEGFLRVIDEEGTVLGYVFLAQGNGYQGVIKLIAGTDAEFLHMKGIEVIESQETPGLGAEIQTDGFKKQFTRLMIDRPINYVKNKKAAGPYEIEAITGATVSSKAVCNILNTRIQELRASVILRRAEAVQE